MAANPFLKFSKLFLFSFRIAIPIVISVATLIVIESFSIMLNETQSTNVFDDFEFER